MRHQIDSRVMAEKNNGRVSSPDRITVLPGAVPARDDHDRLAGYDPYDHTPAALNVRNTANGVASLPAMSIVAE